MTRFPPAVLATAVFGMTLITGLWVVTTNRAQDAASEVVASEFRKNQNLALALDVQTHQLIKGIDQLVLVIKSQYERRGTGLPLDQLMPPAVVADESFTFVGIVDERGDVSESLRRSPAVNIADRKMFQAHQARDSGALLISAPVLGRVSGRWAITLSRRINRPDGSFGGVANISIEPRYLTEIFELATLGPNDIMSLVLLDGSTLARRRGTDFEFGVDISGSPLFRRHAGQAAGNYIGPGGVDGHMRMFSYRTMQAYPVFVSVGTSEDDALAPVRRQARTFYINAMLATLFIAAACTTGIVMILRQRRSNRLLREQSSLLDKARDAIIVEGLDRRVSYWNKSAERLYGWTAEEAVGRVVSDLLFHGADQPRVERAYDQVMDTGEWAGELHPHAKDGRRVIAESRWTLVRDDTGQPVRVLTIDTDVTERRQLEQQFYRGQRLESIGTLAGGIAHDLNNVLTPIMLAVELLDEQVSDPVSREVLETVGKSAKRGAQMVGQVLSFARGQEGDRVEMRAYELIADVERIVRDTVPKDIEIHTEVAPGLPTMLGDLTQLHQVLLNLCVNARDAMPDGGRLTLRADAATLESGEALDRGMAEGVYVVLTVEDTGTGIAPELLDKIFDPFFTTKGPTLGTGLGLSTSLTIVKNHGGHLRVDSEVGRGTRFHITLPASPGPVAAARKPPPAALPRGTGETVLVIDDEAAIRLLMQHVLKAAGYQVLVAGDGEEGVAVFTEHRASIGAVVVDMMMPKLGGIATIRALIALEPRVRVIAASGISANEPAALAEGPQVKQFLSKPFKADTLLKALRDALSAKADG